MQSTSALTPAEEAELAALRRLRAPSGPGGVEPLRAYIGRMSPRLAPAPHLDPLIDLFERSRREEIRALVTYPPRHGKTTTIEHGLAWRIGCDPAAPNLYATYGMDLSNTTARKIRKLVRRTGMPMARDANAVGDWKTSLGGGLYSTSLGAGVTGQGFKGGLVVIDDALKGRKAANSKKVRDEVWDWLVADVFSRAEGGTGIIVNATRWHEDDPHGRIIAGRLNLGGYGRQWEVIHMPAIRGPDGKPIDERLHPDLAQVLWPGSEWDLARLAERRAPSERDWWSLYQGMPRPKDGAIFRGEPTNFESHDWSGWRGIIILDPTASEKTSADHFALGVFAMKGYGAESVMRVLEVERGQEDVPSQAERAMRMQRRYRLLLGIEAVQGFKSIPQMIRKLAPGLTILELSPQTRGWGGDKYTRAQPVGAAWCRGRVQLPIGARWRDEYTAELLAFTGNGDAADDQVDITAYAWNVLYREAAGQSPGPPSTGSVEVIGA